MLSGLVVLLSPSEARKIHRTQMWETLARQAAEVEIQKAAEQDGILDQAGQNAESFLTRLLGDLGFAEVVFTWTTPEPSD